MPKINRIDLEGAKKFLISTGGVFCSQVHCYQFGISKKIFFKIGKELGLETIDTLSEAKLQKARFDVAKIERIKKLIAEGRYFEVHPFII
jgi:hypothetical protein